MIVDLQRFVETERPHWRRLEAVLARLERDAASRMSLPQIEEFHYLYERVSADLAKLSALAGERETRRYLEALVARAYGEIHETRRVGRGIRPLRWFFGVLPRTFRRRIGAFKLSAAATLAGCLFGAVAVTLDQEAREVIMPFEQLLRSPSERVREEEKAVEDRLDGRKSRGAAWYMTHNTRVSIYTMAMGVTWGIGTVVLLFYNGVMLGAVAADYVAAGQSRFLAGWLLPHGAVEIPAILLAGQAGLLLGGALIGRGRREPLSARLREAGGDIVTLIFGVAVLLAWAGGVEAFLSQYHEPAIPYSLKIAFGALELAALSVFLARSGRGPAPGKAGAAAAAEGLRR
jgi:uncharacterized membrane protein SpoIIM required for sporulation